VGGGIGTYSLILKERKKNSFRIERIQSTRQRYEPGSLQEVPEVPHA
jgi:hypothetical protein